MERTVDYAAFDETTDRAAVRAFRRAQGGGVELPAIVGVVLLVAVIAFVTVVGTVVIGANAALGGAGPLGGLGFALPFAAVLVLAVVAVTRRGAAGGTSWADRYRLDRFARANGFVYAHRSPRRGTRA
ncbi:hypothetical protein [Arenivirga flava]|uniref:Uncharacterized protein n=1 Tax=Arenivirga flava TaxID=1930060 RepID=A0AA37UER5_9MICO|nr:hypothetical protein [Arenivirga flava]GMA27743.1 hypothetical protein GCM10025874_09960 [Arenivirga flava]